MKKTAQHSTRIVKLQVLIASFNSAPIARAHIASDGSIDTLDTDTFDTDTLTERIELRQ